MENHASKLVFVGWDRYGGRIYHNGKVPLQWDGGEPYIMTDEEIAEGVKRTQDDLLANGGMLDDGSGWEGCRIPFTDKRPDMAWLIEQRNKQKGNPQPLSS